MDQGNGHNHPGVATTLAVPAQVYREQNNYEEAEKLLKDALKMGEKTLGPNHLALAHTLVDLAVLYSKQEKYKDAEQLCKRALGIRLKVLGQSDPQVASNLNNLAELCQPQGKYIEMEMYYRRALEIFEIESQYGPDHLNVAKTRIDLASCLVKQRKYAEAEVLFKQVGTDVEQE